MNKSVRAPSYPERLTCLDISALVDEREPCTCTLVCEPRAIPAGHYCREEANCANPPPA